MRNLIVGMLLSTALASVAPARASLIITPTFDANIVNDTNKTAIENAIDSAIQSFESTYTNNITVGIYFQEGGGLGTSEFYDYETPYAGAYGTGFYAGLVHNDANPAAIAGLNANGGDALTNGGLNPVGSANDIDLKSADARAVGINVLPGCVPNAAAGALEGLPNGCTYNPGGTGAVDGIISLNTAATFPPGTNNGSNYSLIAVAEHEIDEILGLGSAFENCYYDSSNPKSSQGSAACVAGNTLTLGNNTVFGVGSPEDLFRYTAATGGTRSSFTYNCGTAVPAYFDYGASTGEITQYYTGCAGADWGDWAGGSTSPTGASPQVQDAYGSPGMTIAYGLSELDAMSAIGYTTSEPEPGTWGLLLVSLLSLGLARRRWSA